MISTANQWTEHAIEANTINIIRYRVRCNELHIWLLNPKIKVGGLISWNRRSLLRRLRVVLSLLEQTFESDFIGLKLLARVSDPRLRET
jgi:hypothetical protein